MSDFLKSMGVATLTPNMLKLPFIESFMNGGIYIPHPSEPPLFSRKPGHFNKIWTDWLCFVLKNSPDRGDNFNFRVHECDPMYEEITQKLAQKLGEAILADLEKPGIILPKEPPRLHTANGWYVSHAWVLDTARRDNMPIHEAVALGVSLRPT